MTGLSLYDTTIPPLKIYLNNLHHILTVAEDHYAARSTCLDPTTARLSDDMYSLAQQVQCACKAAQNIPLLVLGEEVTGNVFYENDEQTFDDLKTRILDTIKFIDGSGHSELKGAKAFGREAFEGTENFEVTWQTYKFTGLVYGKFSPCFYFASFHWAPLIFFGCGSISRKGTHMLE